MFHHVYRRWELRSGAQNAFILLYRLFPPGQFRRQVPHRWLDLPSRVIRVRDPLAPTRAARFAEVQGPRLGVALRDWDDG